MYKNGALKKEWNSTICNNMDDPGGHHVKGNRPEGGKKKNYMISLCAESKTVRHIGAES